jgi:transcriptional regulator with XRE-family HTH domain
MTIKKSQALRFMEKITGGPLTLHELLWSIRRSDEISLSDFAKKLGISKSHLCDIEKNRKAVSVERAARFAKILGYSQSQFIRLALQEQLYSAKLKYVITLEAA